MEHFIAEKDYFLRNSSEAMSEFDIIAPNGLYIFTLTGYLMVVKSFHDDLSWDIQRELVRGYFAGLKRGLTYHGTEVVTIGKCCEATGENPRTVSGWIRAHEQELPLQSVIYIEGRNLRRFREENPHYEGSASSLYILTRQGAEIIRSRKRKVLTA